MTNLKRVFLFTFMILMGLVLIPTFCNAETASVYDTESLSNAIANASAEEVTTITLTANIELTHPIEINGKDIIINGAGFTISRDTENWSPVGQNGTLITAGGTGTDLTLRNLNLRGSQKYGVQAYNGGRVVLDGVTIANCEYGGVLVNGGTLEIVDLTLYRNRNNGDANNGIEIGKAADVTNDPKIVMNGTLSSDQTENVLYLSENDELKTFEVENTENSKDKILLDDNKVVVTDENNNILFSSNANPDVIVQGGNEYVPNVIVTVMLIDDKSATVSVQNGQKLTKESLISEIDLEKLNLTDYIIADFYTTSEYKEKYNFDTPITAATTIYAKLDKKAVEAPAPEEPKADVTPKTGVETPIELAIILLTLSTLAIAILKRK